MAFSKITSAELLNKGVTGLDDTPALSVADMQAKFDELPNLAITKHNALVDDLNLKLPNLEGIATIIENSDVKIPTSKAIVDYVVTMGGGDMTKAVYDTDDNGVVDNSEKLGGELPSFYQQSTDNTLDTIDKTITGAINELNSLETINYGTCTNYSASTTYDLGALVIYDNKLYKCTTAITVGEAWDISHWSAIADSKNGIVYNSTDLSFYGVRGADSVLKKLGSSTVMIAGFGSYAIGETPAAAATTVLVNLRNKYMADGNTGMLQGSLFECNQNYKSMTVFADTTHTDNHALGFYEGGTYDVILNKVSANSNATVDISAYSMIGFVAISDWSGTGTRSATVKFE